MAGKRRKILIIKLGHSETLIPEVGNGCSLGDVFRTTAILHLFKEDHVAWLTDSKAIPLLADNPHIDCILPYCSEGIAQMMQDRYDCVINLEKGPDVCALIDRIRSEQYFGFRLNRTTGCVEASERGYEALAVATQADVKKMNNRPWVEILYRMLGAQWRGEGYVLGYRPKSDVAYDLGFNMHVGKLHPIKAWPMGNWGKLATIIGGKYSISHQTHLDDLIGYMEWVHSCRMLVTNDSLGLHLGIAMGKKVLGLFGPTPISELSPHPRLRILSPLFERECMPCLKAECAMNDPCMQYIVPDRVLEAISVWID